MLVFTSVNFKACMIKEMMTFFAHLSSPSSPARNIAIHNVSIRERFVYFACVFRAKPGLSLVCIVYGYVCMLMTISF